jgi:hypothetical protein
MTVENFAGKVSNYEQPKECSGTRANYAFILCRNPLWMHLGYLFWNESLWSREVNMWEVCVMCVGSVMRNAISNKHITQTYSIVLLCVRACKSLQKESDVRIFLTGFGNSLWPPPSPSTFLQCVFVNIYSFPISSLCFFALILSCKSWSTE